MPANPKLTANGRSRMTSSALALAHVLVDDGIGAAGDSRVLNTELLQRATRDDYDRWLTTAVAAGGCVRPVRLRGTVRDVNTVTARYSTVWTPRTCRTRRFMSRAATAARLCARLVRRPTGPIPISSSGPG
jgi:hypothetical protein